ncbi:MAG: hypothetical protein H6832_14175 [Planctomycetes bacterium]|nr:hypothetical protein [Planctomycetota bacterium]MCB9919545.1 hypothetical protein [Planctomycetota bacterium]
MMRSLSLSLVAAVLLGVGVTNAQTTPCASLNDSNTNVANFISSRNLSRPNSWGWRYVPAATQIARGLRIFTNNSFTTGFMQLEIWDEDTTTMMPGKRIATGTFYAPKSATADWVGTNFDKQVLMQNGKSYWFVWVEIGWATFPTEPGGTSMPAAAVWNGTAWQTATTDQLKFRLYCSMIDTKGAAAFGTPCAGASGSIGTAFTNLTPNIGNADYRIEGTGLPSGAPTAIILGAIANFPSVPFGGVAPGCSLNTDIVVTIGAATGMGDVRASAAAGHLFLPLGIPNNPSLVGAYIGVQFATFDAQSANALKYVFTNAVRTTVY